MKIAAALEDDDNDDNKILCAEKIFTLFNIGTYVRGAYTCSLTGAELSLYTQNTYTFQENVFTVCNY